MCKQALEPEHGHFVSSFFPLLQYLGVPVANEETVCVHLHDEALASIHAVPHMSSCHRACGELRIHVVDGNLTSVLAYRLRAVLRAGDLNIQTAFDR